MNQKKLKMAEDMGTQVMDIQEQILGPDYPFTLSIMDNSSNYLQRTGKVAEIWSALQSGDTKTRANRRPRRSKDIDYHEKSGYLAF